MSFKTSVAKIKHNYIWNNKFISFGILFNFLLNIAYFLFLFLVTKGKFHDIVPLHYNIYFGLDSFGPSKNFFVFPQISFIVFLVNSFLCYHYYKYSRAISYFLLASSIFVNIVMILSYILIILFIEI